jgi:hypothetical protein
LICGIYLLPIGWYVELSDTRVQWSLQLTTWPWRSSLSSQSFMPSTPKISRDLLALPAHFLASCAAAASATISPSTPVRL